MAERDGQAFVFAGTRCQEVDRQEPANQHVPVDKRIAAEGQRGRAEGELPAS